MIKSILSNFIFLIFITIFFVILFLLFPFLDNYFSDTYVDISIVQNQNMFGIGMFKFDFLSSFLINLIISILTIMILSKINIKNEKVLKVTIGLINLLLFIGVNQNVARFIFIPFDFVSITNTILILLLFYFYWNFIFKIKSIKES